MLDPGIAATRKPTRPRSARRHRAASTVMRFEREGRRPDGAAVKVAFSLAFADDKSAPDIHFAACQQHYPENFWNPAFQRHANSAPASPASSLWRRSRRVIVISCKVFAGVESNIGNDGLPSIPRAARSR